MSMQMEGTTIYCNRGDQFTVTLNAREDSLFARGDVIKFSIMKENDCTKVLFEKKFTVEEDAALTFDCLITSADTRFDKPIKSGEKRYWYEIELNDKQWIIEKVIKHDFGYKRGTGVNFGGMSCEQIAEYCINAFNCSACEVLEDGFGGAYVRK